MINNPAWLQFLIEYKTVFATILGSIATLIVTYFLRNMGRIKFKFLESELREGARLYFELVVYNKSDTPKSLYDFHIEFNGTTQKFDALIRNRETIPTSEENTTLTKEFKIINLPPKTMLHYSLKCYPQIDEEDIKDDKYKVYFVCKNTKDRTIRKCISSYQFISE